MERLAKHNQMLDTMIACIDAIISGRRFVLAGLSYGGYLVRGVVARKAATIDGRLLCAPHVKGDPAQAHLPRRTPVVEDAALAAPLEPGASLIVAQTPPVVAAVRVLKLRRMSPMVPGRGHT